MQIGTGPKNLGSLFSGQTTVSVPSFQRNYSWTKEQLDQFLEDIFSCADTGTSHFWGPVVFLRLPEKETNYEVIDGQQRITTAMILLSLLRDEAYELSNKFVNEGTPGAFDVYSAIRNFLYVPHTFVDQRFKASYLIESVMSNFVLADPFSADNTVRKVLTLTGKGMNATTKKNSKELRKAAIHLQKSLGKKLGEFGTEAERKIFMNKVFDALTAHFEIHSMELGNEDDAYVLFETLNDRGLRLNPSDLLKTFTLKEIRKIGTPQDLENALETWDSTVSNLGDNDFTKFLRHYMLTKTKDPVQASKIFSQFKTQVKKLEPNGAAKNLYLVSNASLLYSQLLNVTQNNDPVLQSCFIRMNSYSDTHRVFLLGILQINLTLDQLRQLARAVERLSFRWIACGKNAQQLESLYQSWVHSLNADSSIKNISLVCDSLIAASPSDLEMAQLPWNDTIDLQKYVLRRLEESTGGAVLAWSSPITLEHLAPQKPGNQYGPHWFGAVCQRDVFDSEDKNYDDYSANWGNLTLLEKPLNSSIQNADWPTKVSGVPASRYEGLNASTMNLNQEIRTCTRWTLAHIKNRADWIRDNALNMTSETWVRTGTATTSKWREPEALKNS